MGMSGVEASDECSAVFERVKKRELGYVVFTIKMEGGQPKCIDPLVEKASVAVDENEQLWKDMVTNFPANEGRFAVFDLRQNMSDGRLAEKIVMITWAPSTASVRNRMIVASSQDALKSKLDAAGLPVHQVNDIDELDHKDVIAKFIRA